jgi:hypothetical protein
MPPLSLTITDRDGEEYDYECEAFERGPDGSLKLLDNGQTIARFEPFECCGPMVVQAWEEG